MTTAVIKKAKGLIGRLTKEATVDVERGKRDWKQAVSESAEQTVHVPDSVIHKLGAILGINPSDAVDKFRTEVANIEAHRIILMRIAKYDSEMREFEAVHSWEQANKQLASLQAEVLSMKKELHRYDQFQILIGRAYAELKKVIVSFPEYFDEISLKDIREAARKPEESSS
jgi:hypothetical protein